MWATDQWKAGERAERDAIRMTIAEAQKEVQRLPVVPLVVLSAGEEIGWPESAPLSALKWQLFLRWASGDRRRERITISISLSRRS
jgi:hypothetical protein